MKKHYLNFEILHIDQGEWEKKFLEGGALPRVWPWTWSYKKNIYYGHLLGNLRL